MKKWTKILAIGACACLALGATGALVACGGDGGGKGGNEGGGGAGSKSVYYLVGSSLGGALSVRPDGADEATWQYEYWYAGFATAAEVPDAICFKTTAQKDVYELTIDLYKSDTMQIVEAGKGWTGQMGSEVLSPAASDTADLGSSAGGGDNGNILVQKNGNYTLTLNMSGASAVVTYTWNSEPVVPLHLEYDYFLTGEKVTAGKEMYVDYTKFTANEAKTSYELEIGVQQGEVFSLTSTVEQDQNQHPAWDSSMVDLADDDTKELVELEMKGEGDEAEATGKFKFLGETGTYKFTLSEQGEGQDTDKRTLKVEKVADSVPAYDYYIMTNDKSEGALPTDAVYHKMTLNTETGKYEYSGEFEYNTDDKSGDFISIVVFPASDNVTAETADVENAKFVIGTAYADDYISNQIDAQAADWTVMNTDTFTITLDPVSMIVNVAGEHDSPTYTVYLHGQLAGESGWSDHNGTDIMLTDTHTAVIRLDLEVGGEFGFRTLKKGGSEQIDWGDNGREGTELLGTSGNFSVTEAGTYTFVITIDDDGKITNIDAYLGDVYTVNIWGNYITNWSDGGLPMAVTSTEGEELTCSMTVNLTAGREFGFQVKVNNGSKSDWAAGDKVGEGEDYGLGKSGNFKVTAENEGTYKFTFTIEASENEAGVTVTKIVIEKVTEGDEGEGEGGGETGGETDPDEGDGEGGGETGGETDPDEGDGEGGGETGGDVTPEPEPTTPDEGDAE